MLRRGAAKGNDGHRWVSQTRRGHMFWNGTEPSNFLGIYKAEQFSATQNQWIVNPEVRIQITVEVDQECISRWLERVMLNVRLQEQPQGHLLVDRQGEPSGRFTFTSQDSGDHSICLSPVSNSWFDNTKTVSDPFYSTTSSCITPLMTCQPENDF